MKRVMLPAVWAAVCGFLMGPVPAMAQGRFPHERHSIFFSECTACHAGMTSGVQAEAYPEFTTCAACHNGTVAPDITWERPQPRASNLSFPHERHDFGCAFCHQPGGAEDLANLAFPEPQLCLGCHAPDAETHFEASGQCQTCHVPVVESRLEAEAVADIPSPAYHGESSFSLGHGSLATANAADCSVCHDRSSCLTCHGGATHMPDAVLALPEPLEGGPRGVQIPSTTGGSGFHPAGFVTNHSSSATTGRLTCTSCHSENSCVECHDGPGSPGFHPLNFLASHGPESYGRVYDCTSCHTSEGFCRECHLNLGLKGGTGVVAPFHDNQALWVLTHPQAARQDLESCVACHQQRDCLRCHSATSGLRVNPHGPDWNSGIGDKNQAMCLLCHISGGIGGH